MSDHVVGYAVIEGIAYKRDVQVGLIVGDQLELAHQGLCKISAILKLLQTLDSRYSDVSSDDTHTNVE